MSLKNKHNKKSQYVGDHGGRYTDIDGMSKQFTYIDHDKKPTQSTYIETGNAAETFKKMLNEGIDEILQFPAAAAVWGAYGDQYEQLVERSVEGGITWRENLVREVLNINPDAFYTLHSRVWKNTVREQYWFEEMSHEDIMAGEWRKWV